MLHSLATAVPAASFANEDGIKSIGLFIAFVALLIVGVKVTMGGGKGDVKKAANSGIVSFIGIAIIAAAFILTALVAAATGLLTTIFPG